MHSTFHWKEILYLPEDRIHLPYINLDKFQHCEMPSLEDIALEAQLHTADLSTTELSKAALIHLLRIME